MKKSRSIVLGTLITVSLSLSACGESTWDDEEEETYSYSPHYHGFAYSRMGVPMMYPAGQSDRFVPVPSTHPLYSQLVAENSRIRAGKLHPGGSVKVSVPRGGFGGHASAKIGGS